MLYLSLAEYLREMWRETLRLGHPPGLVPRPPTPALALTGHRVQRRSRLSAR